MPNYTGVLSDEGELHSKSIHAKDPCTHNGVTSLIEAVVPRGSIFDIIEVDPKVYPIPENAKSYAGDHEGESKNGVPPVIAVGSFASLPGENNGHPDTGVLAGMTSVLSSDHIALINSHTFVLISPNLNGNPAPIPVNLIDTGRDVNGRTPPGVN